MARWFRLRKFDELQHYTDRSPPWIKLYNTLLDDYDVLALSDQARWHLVAIMLLASRSNNRLPWDEKWISGRIGATFPVDLEVLAKGKFIEEVQEDAPLAKRKRRASKALEREEKRERRGEKTAGAVSQSVFGDGEEARWRARLRNYKPGGFWVPEWGPRPEQARAVTCPADLYDAWKQRQQVAA